MTSPMKCIVTGTAGFIGSHLAGRLTTEGFTVTGIDSFTDYYPKWIKERNLAGLLRDKNFRFVEGDLCDLGLPMLLDGADAVFHLAAQAGVRASWGDNFSVYIENNIRATQRLLEATKNAGIKKFVFASSSSVYGLTPVLPMVETAPLRPWSPYGVTKLAAENLCFLYFKNHGIPAVSLRFFTVYGPRQRPDMAFHKFFKAIAEGKEIPVYGTGGQTRDFTYVDDIVEASVAALERGVPGEVYNVGGGNRRPLEEVIPLLEEVCGKKAVVLRLESQKGDVPDTLADIRKATKDLAYSPKTGLEDGLLEEWRWVRDLYSLANERT